MKQRAQSVSREYLRKRGVSGPWRLVTGEVDCTFRQAVVIPCLAESRRIFRTLATLALNDASELARTLVVCVVNHPEGHTSREVRADNKKTLTILHSLMFGMPPPAIPYQDGEKDLQTVLANGLRMAYVDAASPDRGLPARHAGVGLARKIGLDLALQAMESAEGPGLLYCLDADTFVAPNYLKCVREHFEATNQGATVLPYLHRLAGAGQAALEYELFLRSYVLGLRYAGSPYAFHTVGSAMCCTAEAYARSGGMNRRRSTEDFYFLENLAKTCGISQVRGTFVFPEARISDRVPFLGTGWAISRYLKGERNICHVYDSRVFDYLANWLMALSGSVTTGPEKALHEAQLIHPDIHRFIENQGFLEIWQKLRRNYRDDGMFLRQLHVWFDGLKTLRMVNEMARASFPRKPALEEIPHLLYRLGVDDCPQEVPGSSASERLFSLLHTCRILEYGQVPQGDRLWGAVAS